MYTPLPTTTTFDKTEMENSLQFLTDYSEMEKSMKHLTEILKKIVSCNYTVIIAKGFVIDLDVITASWFVNTISTNTREKQNVFFSPSFSHNKRLKNAIYQFVNSSSCVFSIASEDAKDAIHCVNKTKSAVLNGWRNPEDENAVWSVNSVIRLQMYLIMYF